MTQTFSSTGRDTFVGSPRSRIDGPAKVTGLAKYAGEFAAPDLAYGVVVSSAIAKGRITAIDSAAARLTAADRTGMGSLFKVLGVSAPDLGPLPGFPDT